MSSDGEASTESGGGKPRIRRLAVLKGDVWIHPETGVDLRARSEFRGDVVGAALAAVTGDSGAQIDMAAMGQAGSGPAAGETAGIMAA